MDNQETIKRRLASGEVIEVTGSGRDARAHYRGSGESVYIRDVWKLVSAGWAIQAGDGTFVAYTPDRMQADRTARLAKQAERRRQLREARLDRWAHWILQAAGKAERRAVAERIATQAMILGGLDDDAVILEGDPPRED